MADKVVVITGANSGIGFETALALASLGARIVLGCRNPQRAEDAVAQLRMRSGNDAIENSPLDLGDLESVRSFAGSLGDLDRIDVLVNNAGLVHDVRAETAQGFELVFGTNHLGHFALTEALLPQLRASARARIINVASFGHAAAVGGIDWPDIGRHGRFRGMRVYGESKLANILHAEALASRLEGTGVVANSLHPGPVSTNFGREGDTHGLTARLMDLQLGPVRRTLLKSPAEGAETSIHLATSADGGESSGTYWNNSKLSRTAPWSRRRGDADELWNNSRRMIALAS